MSKGHHGRCAACGAQLQKIFKHHQGKGGLFCPFAIKHPQQQQEAAA